MTEFVPARPAAMAGFIAYRRRRLPGDRAARHLIVPKFGWRSMFVLGGIGALVVWYMRKSLPESPRWLEARDAPPRRKR